MVPLSPVRENRLPMSTKPTGSIGRIVRKQSRQLQTKSHREIEERKYKEMKGILVAILGVLTGREHEALADNSVSKGRARTADVAITYRMGANAPGDITRLDASDTEPAIMDGSNPVLAYGLAGVYDRTSANGLRSVISSDTTIDGFVVRPYPQQANAPGTFGAAQGFGTATPPSTGVVDVLKRGYMAAAVGGNLSDAQALTKGSTIYIWKAASTGNHVQGGVEAIANAGNTIALPTGNFYFNGPSDANGIAEIVYNI
jgi:hypothetical protein